MDLISDIGGRSVFLRRIDRDREVTSRMAADRGGLASPEEVTDASFSELATGAVIVLELWAPWCPTCLSLTPTCDDVARRHPGRVRHARCDVDANPRTAAALRVRSVPVVVVLDGDGTEVGRVSGAFSGRSLRRLIADALAQRA